MKLWQKILKTGVVTEPLRLDDEDSELHILSRRIDERARRVFGRSLHIRQVDAGDLPAGLEPGDGGPGELK